MKREGWFLLFFILMGVSFFFDREILNFVLGLRNGGLDLVMIVLSHFMFGVLALIFSSYLLWDKKKVAYLWGGIAFSYVVSLVLKYTFRIGRPLESGLSTFSFPSSHVTVYFFLFAFMAGAFEKYRYYYLGLAVLVGVSRLYLGVHYVSDVIGGSLLGMGLYMLLKKWAKIEN